MSICAKQTKPLKRERHATPTLDELMSDLSGAKGFSKLHVNQGYNQLELAEESRHITTFATHVGLHRYTKLFFGINSAAEVFQDAIRQVLSGLKGTINISDDILVYGSTVQEHNANLKSVLNRLREKGPTLNREKCELNKACVEYFGHSLVLKVYHQALRRQMQFKTWHHQNLLSFEASLA